MRYGCCVNMVTQTADVSGTDIVPVLREAGYDYAELSLAHLCAMDKEHFYRVKEELLYTGLPAEACNNFFPPTLPLTGASSEINKIKEYLEKALSRASELGVRTIVFGSGGARNIPDSLSYSEAMEQLAQILRLINSYAASLEIVIAIEPLRKKECNIINTYQEALVLADLTDCGNVHCLLDIFHLTEEKEHISVIRKKPGRLAHVHFCEPGGRIFPVAANRHFYKTMLQSIRKTGYNNRISIEACSADFRNDAAKALQLMKSIEEEIELNNNNQ